MMQPRFVDTYGYQTKLVIPNADFVVYGHPTNFNYFVNTDVTAAQDADRAYQTSSRKGHTRRKYVGDPNPRSVAATSYTYVDDPGRKIGNSIPGWSFILDDGTERRQFTCSGDVLMLIAWLEDEMTRDTKLYTNGARYIIKAAVAEGGLVADS